MIVSVRKCVGQCVTAIPTAYNCLNIYLAHNYLSIVIHNLPVPKKHERRNIHGIINNLRLVHGSVKSHFMNGREMNISFVYKDQSNRR